MDEHTILVMSNPLVKQALKHEERDCEWRD